MCSRGNAWSRECAAERSRDFTTCSREKAWLRELTREKACLHRLQRREGLASLPDAGHPPSKDSGQTAVGRKSGPTAAKAEGYCFPPHAPAQGPGRGRVLSWASGREHDGGGSMVPAEPCGRGDRIWDCQPPTNARPDRPLETPSAGPAHPWFSRRIPAISFSMRDAAFLLGNQHFLERG